MIDRAASTPRRRLFLTLLGPAMMLGFISLLVHLSRRADRLLRLPPLPGDPLRLLVGLPIVACGALLAAACVLRFVSARGTPVPFNPPKELVVSGPYAVTRNPMMTGLFAVFLGVGILLRSPAMVALGLPVVAILMTLVVRFVEEPELELRFGETYRSYKAATPRFFPWPRRERP